MSKNNELVSVIIINWNGLDYLKLCLPSLCKQNYKNTEIIVVDNASVDDSVRFIEKNFPRISIIRNVKNYGFAGANNIGYRKAKGKYILFLNNDTVVTKTFISELVKVVSSENKIAGAQSKLLLMDDHSRLDSIGAFLTPTGFLYHNGLLKKDISKYNLQIPLYSAKGASMLFKKKVLDSIKVNNEIYDNDYFAYFEETEMCHRVWLAGYSIVYAPKSIIYHKVGGTSKRITSSFIQFHSYKNRINAYIKNLALNNLFKILPIHIILCIIFAYYSLCKLDWRMFYAIHKAIIWNILNLKQTLKKRKYIQKVIRKVKDEEIFPIILKKAGIIYLYYLLTGQTEKVKKI